MSPVQLSEAQIKTIGEVLKSAREKRGDNIAEAAFKIALSPSQLRAIEAGDMRPFYSPNYFMQAAQRYANLLGAELPAPPVAAETTPEPIEPAEIASASEPAPSMALPSPAPETQTAVEFVEPPPRAVAPPTTVAPDADLSEASRTGGGLRWGWIAFAAAVLITLGVLKISLEQPPKPEPAKVGEPAPAMPAAEDPKPPGPAATPVTASGSPPAITPPAVSAVSKLPQSPALVSDGQLTVQSSTWVQVVKNNGEKINIKAEPGQKVEFPSAETAAIVFGQPEKAILTIQGKAVNLAPFITQDSPPRALVILNRINSISP